MHGAPREFIAVDPSPKGAPSRAPPAAATASAIHSGPGPLSQEQTRTHLEFGSTWDVGREHQGGTGPPLGVRGGGVGGEASAHVCHV